MSSKSIYTTLAPKKKYREVHYSPALNFMSLIDSRMDGVYDRMSVYLLILMIRDVLYGGKNKYMALQKRRAVMWFKITNDKHPMGYGTICGYLGINPYKFWLQIRRWVKVNPEHLASALKSAESGIFTTPKRGIDYGASRNGEINKNPP